MRSDRRGQVIGRSLMEAAHSWAAERQLGHVSLNVWEFNEPGIGFDQALGYQSVSRQMERPLPGGLVVIASGL